MDKNKLAKTIIANVGGESNVNSVVHCATRLRFAIKDRSNVDKKAVEQTEGVISVVESGGQFQVVIGNSVGDVYKELGTFTKLTDDSIPTEQLKGNIFNRAIDLISGIFTPLLGALAGAGILKGLLMILTTVGWLSESSGSYQILFAAADSIFYFLPVILAYTSARKFGANVAVAMVIAGALIYPNMITLTNSGEAVYFFGIPVILMSYSSTVIPIILAVWVQSVVEKFSNKRIHEAAKNFLTPLLCLIVVVPLTFLVIGPIGTYAGQGLAAGYTFVYNLSPIVAGAVIGALWQIFVIFGIHWGFVPLMINNISKFGSDTLVAMLGPSNFAQAGASLGVFFKTKDAKVKAISGSAALSGIFGITEPSIYGVTLRYKKPFIIASISGAIAGAIVGAVGSAGTAAVVVGALTLPVFFGKGFVGFLIACLVAYLFSAIMTYLFGYNDSMLDSNDKNKGSASTAQQSGNQTSDESVTSPLTGQVVPLSSIKDEAFATGAMGQGIAVEPSEGKIFAPVDGIVTAAVRTGHAYGILSNFGAEMLIHVGMDTVKLKGQHFTMHVQEGDRVQKGQLMVEFDMEAIRAAGYSLTTPIVVINSDQYKEVKITDSTQIVAGQPLIFTIQ